jgi:hypothetical protein
MTYSQVTINSIYPAGLSKIRPGRVNVLFQKVIFAFVLTLCLTFYIAETAFAQAGSGYYNPNDETFKLLGLKRAKEDYEKASKDLERVKTLFQEGHKSQRDLDDAQEFYSNAEVNYQQQMLSVIFESQYVTISRAVKYSSDRGEKIIRITLDNTSSGSAELNKLANIDEKLFKTLEPDVINNIYISIKNNDAAIIGQPYEQKIERLLPNQPKELEFVLLQDLDIVSVCLKYGNNASDEKKIYLQKDVTINKVNIRSDQFSQEVELGKSSSYDLSLELFSGNNDAFKLEVINLPSQINRYFLNFGTETRLSLFKFTESTSTQKVSLKVFLPDRASDSIVIGQSIKFYVLAIPQNRVDEIKLDFSKHYSDEELINMNIGFIKLDLVPRGTGELLVKAQQLFFSIKPGESVQVPVDLVNKGTRSLNNVQIDVDLPLNWTQMIAPKTIDSLKVSEEKRAVITIMPGADVAAGRYEIRVTTKSLSDEQPISGEDKTINVEIKPETNLWGISIIILLILGLVGGMVVFGIKLSRR